ncbi:hypothetical protein [Streptomyces sp. HUAS TT7]|uniref:hypothetical protein n=1 Tax=Streptomyces sp. HUAS TT7 TaxID=3447507 RepID=UPI003F65D481
MPDEARRWADRGTDVVVAYVECHERPHTLGRGRLAAPTRGSRTMSQPRAP